MNARQMRTAAVRSPILLALLLALPAVAWADFELTWFTVDGGGGQSLGGIFEIEGTLGQCDASPAVGMSGGDYTLFGGYWAPMADTCPADFEPLYPGYPEDTWGDDVVDLADMLGVLGHWGRCPYGPCRWDNAPEHDDGTWGDGVVDMRDLLGVVGDWGPCP